MLRGYRAMFILPRGVHIATDADGSWIFTFSKFLPKDVAEQVRRNLKFTHSHEMEENFQGEDLLASLVWNENGNLEFVYLRFYGGKEIEVPPFLEGMVEGSEATILQPRAW